MANHVGAMLLVAAIAIGLTVRIAALVSQKHRIFPRR
jgi:hypothetical protein